MLKLYNTLSRKKQIFKPLKKGKAGLYTCGPTVYWFAHIGNLRTYIFEDILKRVLEYSHYKVKHIMNITDVGHLTSDADTGEDKLEKGAKRERKTVWQIAEFYTKAFKQDINRLNIKPPNIWIKATDTIKDQLNLIKILEKKGFTYKISDGVYFDTSKLKTYGRLWKTKKRQDKTRARVEMVSGKKNPTDFALWKFSPKTGKRQMEWKSPWGVGFPGWHTECVVMGIKNLGIVFDIHCGGIDHISIHHTNEIAQAEAAYGKVFARYWLHGEFLILDKGKMAKSEGNIIILENLIKKGFNPLAYRYLCLGAHYRSKLCFSLNALKGAQNSLDNLYQKITELTENSSPSNSKHYENISRSVKNYQKRFLGFIQDDLNMPKALALMWQMIKDKKIPAKAKYKLLMDFDKVFGLDLSQIKKIKIPEKIQELVKQREQERKQKNYQKADEIRAEIKKQGYVIEDTKTGIKIKKISV
ncbi:cysteine--tRNA ligase [Candidatus Parcubacteria bacterium]|nr:cysteine--tRNA ligase [Candidatus Parcubacteria bacterium]